MNEQQIVGKKEKETDEERRTKDGKRGDAGKEGEKKEGERQYKRTIWLKRDGKLTWTKGKNETSKVNKEKKNIEMNK